MPTCILSEVDLIRDVQQAVIDGRLGLQRGAAAPAGVDRRGGVCAIAAALPVDVVRAVQRNGDERLN